MTPEREKELRAYFAGRGPIDLKGQEVFDEVDRLRTSVDDIVAHIRQHPGIHRDVKRRLVASIRRFTKT